VGRAVKQVTVSLKEFLCPVTVVNVKIDAGDSLEAVLLPRPIGALASHMYSNAGASSAIGFVGVRFQSNDLKIVFYNQRGLEALHSAGLITEHNTPVVYDGPSTGMMRRFNECTSTRAELEKNTEAMAAVVGWYDTSLRILDGNLNTVFYTGKWCTADPVHSGQQQFI
jgi:hypothetical protein